MQSKEFRAGQFDGISRVLDVINEYQNNFPTQEQHEFLVDVKKSISNVVDNLVKNG